MRRIIKVNMLMVQWIVNWFKKYMMVLVWSNHVQLIIHFYFASIKTNSFIFIIQIYFYKYNKNVKYLYLIVKKSQGETIIKFILK